MDAKTIRLDKWLWHARFFKSRTQATAFIAAGRVRVNGNRQARPAALVRIGDVLTFRRGDNIRIVEIAAISSRRGPAHEAQMLYADK